MVFCKILSIFSVTKILFTQVYTSSFYLCIGTSKLSTTFDALFDSICLQCEMGRYFVSITIFVFSSLNLHCILLLSSLQDFLGMTTAASRLVSSASLLHLHYLHFLTSTCIIDNAIINGIILETDIDFS